MAQWLQALLLANCAIPNPTHTFGVRSDSPLLRALGLEKGAGTKETPTPKELLRDYPEPVLPGPHEPSFGFLPKALLVAVLSAVVCGVVGAHVVLRGMAFIGDAVAHAVFPGLAIAFALQASVVLGGAVAGIVVAVLIAVFSQRRRIKEDTIIGIFFAAAFAAGLVVISKVQGYTASLTSFLFGSITGVATEDIVLVAVVGTVVIALLLVFHKELVAVSLDRETAAAQNIRVFAFDLLLYLAVTAAVVMSVRTVGNILVLALLVTPAATTGCLPIGFLS